ncbi:hypothetical protein GCM10027184_52780 [Saccharothrix stipae]
MAGMPGGTVAAIHSASVVGRDRADTDMARSSTSERGLDAEVTRRLRHDDKELQIYAQSEQPEPPVLV